VYSMDVDANTYQAYHMHALLCGDKDANTDEFNTCNTENIAQPDNIAYVAGHDGLIIGALVAAGKKGCDDSFLCFLACFCLCIFIGLDIRT
jgi:hypothetical protein